LDVAVGPDAALEETNFGTLQAELRFVSIGFQEGEFDV
jgi:hypothetical protein